MSNKFAAKALTKGYGIWGTPHAGQCPTRHRKALRLVPLSVSAPTSTTGACYGCPEIDSSRRSIAISFMLVQITFVCVLQMFTSFESHTAVRVGMSHPPPPLGTGGGHRDDSDTGPESDLEAPEMWTILEGVPSQPRNQGAGEDHQPPLHTPHQEVAASPPPPPPKHNCLRMAYAGPLFHGCTIQLADIKVCTPLLRVPCPSTGRSNPPSNWLS